MYCLCHNLKVIFFFSSYKVNCIDSHLLKRPSLDSSMEKEWSLHVLNVFSQKSEFEFFRFLFVCFCFVLLSYIQFLDLSDLPQLLLWLHLYKTEHDVCGCCYYKLGTCYKNHHLHHHQPGTQAMSETSPKEQCLLLFLGCL